jgi:mannosyltransferase
MSYETAIRVPAAEGPTARTGAPVWPILLVACAIAATLNLWDLGTRPFWLDEAYSAWFAELGWRELWFETPRYEPHPPFYYSLLKLWSGVFGSSVQALRAVSVLAATATVAALVLAARELAWLCGLRSPTRLLLAAGAIAALSPRIIFAGQEARPYALLLLAFAIALWAWLRLARDFRAARGAPGHAANWALLGGATTVLLWLHAIGILYAGSLLAALLIAAAPEASRARWLRLSTVVGIATALWLPCLAMILGRAGEWGSGWLEWTPARFPGGLMALAGLGRFQEMATPLLAGILVPVLAYVGLRRLADRNRAIGWGLALLVLVPPFAAAALSQFVMPIFLLRTQIGVLAPLYLAVAFALAILPARRAAFAGAALAALFLVNLVQMQARPPMERWDAVADAIQAGARPGDAIWVYPNDLHLPLARALAEPRSIAPIPAPYPALDAAGTRPAGSPAVVALDGRAASAWAGRQSLPPDTGIWLVRGTSGLFDPDDEVLHALAGSGRLRQVGAWGRIELWRIDPARE